MWLSVLQLLTAFLNWAASVAKAGKDPHEEFQKMLDDADKRIDDLERAKFGG